MPPGEAGIIRGVVPRLCLAVLLALLAVVPVAGAQDSPTTTIAHDSTLDGTPGEIHSGFYGGDPAVGDPLAARYEGTFETFETEVPEGTRHSRLEASVGWADRRVDLDLYVYRLGADGRPDGPAVARSTGKVRASERAVYAPSRPRSSPAATSSSSTTSAPATPTTTPAPRSPTPPTAGSGRARRRTRTPSRAP